MQGVENRNTCRACLMSLKTRPYSRDREKETMMTNQLYIFAQKSRRKAIANIAQLRFLLRKTARFLVAADLGQSLG